jgi:hypothetical protein
MMNNTQQVQITTNMSSNQTYTKYKQYEVIAQEAVENGNYLKAEEFFLNAAAARKEFCNKFFGGRWEAGHKARYDSMVGAAWIQRQAYEDDKAVEAICYERDVPTSRTAYSVWNKLQWNKPQENFNAILEQHAKIQKKRRSKPSGDMSSLISAFVNTTI